jgi:hypothetical protein
MRVSSIHGEYRWGKLVWAGLGQVTRPETGLGAMVTRPETGLGAMVTRPETGLGAMGMHGKYRRVKLVGVGLGQITRPETGLGAMGIHGEYRRGKWLGFFDFWGEVPYNMGHDGEIS